MTDYKNIVAQNLADLRRSCDMTQIQLADRLNYSDKAVSKWERGESLPDVAVLKSIADLFGVTVDYLLCSHEEVSAALRRSNRRQHINRLIITLLSVSLVWLVATAFFVIIGLLPEHNVHLLSLIYIYAIPATCIVLLVFNSLWGKRIFAFAIVSALVWTTLLCVYLSFLPVYDLLLIFLIGIPAQIIIVLWANLRPKSAVI